MVAHVVKRSAAPTAKAIAFFRKHAAMRRGAAEESKRHRAKLLARAEAEASARGWRVEFEGDPDGYDEAVGAVLRDDGGHVIASRWEIARPTRDERRVVGAELAMEAMEGR